MSHSLTGRVAVITGGTQGIGLAIAKEFAGNGATVVVTGRDQGRLDDAVAQIGSNASGVKADAASPAAMEALLKDVKATHGRLDTVVANAVVDDHAPLGKITRGAVRQDDHDQPEGRPVRRAVGGAADVERRFDHPDRIDCLCGAASGMSIYGAIKAGFHGMVKGTGIRINVLSPGAVDTPSLRRALGKAAGAERVDGIVRSMAEKSPLGRIGDAREIGQVAVFLASDASSYVNGVELFADGGLTQVA